jgi:hypothetical protein
MPQKHGNKAQTSVSVKRVPQSLLLFFYWLFHVTEKFFTFPHLVFKFISTNSITCNYSKHFHSYQAYQSNKFILMLGKNNFEYLLPCVGCIQGSKNE